MARFNQNTLEQVAGFDGEILANELVYNQKSYFNMTFQDSAKQAINLTGCTFDAQIIRRLISNIVDARTGLTFDISDYTPTPTPIPLTIDVVNALTGQVRLIFDDSTWGLVSTDPNLDIASDQPAGYSGRIKVTFPATATTPAYDRIIFLLFIVRSDGIVS